MSKSTHIINPTPNNSPNLTNQSIHPTKNPDYVTNADIDAYLNRDVMSLAKLRAMKQPAGRIPLYKTQSWKYSTRLMYFLAAFIPISLAYAAQYASKIQRDSTDIQTYINQHGAQIIANQLIAHDVNPPPQYDGKQLPYEFWSKRSPNQAQNQSTDAKK